MDFGDDCLESAGSPCPSGTTADRAEAIAAVYGDCVTVTTCSAKNLSVLVSVQFPSSTRSVFSLFRQMLERGGLKGQGQTS